MENWLAPHVESVRAVLGDAAYESAFAECMTMDEALGLAMKT
jgi:hypothetical protein